MKTPLLSTVAVVLLCACPSDNTKRMNIPEGEKCRANMPAVSGCSVGLFCGAGLVGKVVGSGADSYIEGTCKKFLTKGQVCTADDRCVSGLSCMGSAGRPGTICDEAPKPVEPPPPAEAAPAPAEDKAAAPAPDAG